jgi:LytS/YehU family sensor histidine kinase
VFGLQHLAFHYFVGVHPAVWSARWLGRWLWWTSLSLLGSTALWLAYRPGFPLARRPVAALAGGALAAAAVVVALRRTLAREQQTLETQASHSAAELAGLRAQINPHFLFNALNSLYATALQGDSDKTAQGIQQLGEMMRFMLEENNQDRIPLHKEVAYLRSYIDLQRLRLDETQDIDIRINLQTPERDIYLAPMLLSPLVENAFNHGISLQAPSWIHITLTLDTTQLYFKVHNSRHPRPGPEANKSPGVGLTNVRQRLELLYPQRHELTVQSSEQDYFVALTLRYW